MLSGPVHRFVDHARVARLATADAGGVPHLVPVCFAVAMSRLYITIDEKPKQASGRAMKRIRNILENPAVAVLVDRYEDDWTRLGWVMMRGRAEILDGGSEHAAAQAVLKARYLQLAAMRIEQEPVIAIAIEKVTHWGNLDIPQIDWRDLDAGRRG
jgi:PPOX class probable F420-dependent enzyme